AEVVAEGSVRFAGEGKKASADWARQNAQQRTVTLEGRERPAEVVETATGRAWRGPSLTWPLTPDSIPTVSGELGRSRIVGSPPGSGREQVGQQTDRGRPR